MKTLKFAAHLVPLILSGEKTSTWRLFDDKDIKTGDTLTFINADTKEEFAHVKVSFVQEKKLKDLEEIDFTGHEKYENTDEILRVFREYYGDKVNMDTFVKIVDFVTLN